MSTTIRTSGVVAALVLLSFRSPHSHATTLGEAGAAMGTAHAVAGTGGPSAARSVRQVRAHIGSSPGRGGEWERAGTTSRASGGRTWSTGGWKTSGATSHR